MNRILIIKLGSIGDIVHTLSAVATLRQSFPKAEIDWLVEKKSSVVLKCYPYLNQVIEIDTQKWRRSLWHWKSYKEFWSCLTKLRNRKYDVAFDFQGLWKSAFFGFLAGAQNLVGFHKNYLKEPSCRIFYTSKVLPEKNLLHIIEINQELVRSQEASFSLSKPVEFKVLEKDKVYVNELLEQYQLEDFIILNPGGGWITKKWPAKNYGLLHNKIKNLIGIPTVFTWGPGEKNLIEEVRSASTGEPLLCFPTTIPQFIALVQRSRLFIGGDTGPLHLATACETPVVGIYGPTNPLRNGPFNPSDISVFQSVPCGPCYKRTCEKYQCQCMTLITVDEVFEAVVKRLKNEQLDT